MFCLLGSQQTPSDSTWTLTMGRPKDLPVLFQDLLVKYKSKAIADKEYKTYMLMAKVLNHSTTWHSAAVAVVCDTTRNVLQEQKLDKNAKLTDINTTTEDHVVLNKPPPQQR